MLPEESSLRRASIRSRSHQILRLFVAKRRKRPFSQAKTNPKIIRTATVAQPRERKRALNCHERSTEISIDKENTSLPLRPPNHPQGSPLAVSQTIPRNWGPSAAVGQPARLRSSGQPSHCWGIPVRTSFQGFSRSLLSPGPCGLPALLQLEQWEGADARPLV